MITDYLLLTDEGIKVLDEVINQWKKKATNSKLLTDAELDEVITNAGKLLDTFIEADATKCPREANYEDEDEYQADMEAYRLYRLTYDIFNDLGMEQHKRTIKRFRNKGK